MSEYSGDLGSLWRSQPDEAFELDAHVFVGRRMREMSSTSRSEIMLSIGAALFFVAVLAWRFRPMQQSFPLIGFGLIAVWALLILLRFRRYMQGQRPSGSDLANTCLRHYRNELEHRRNHLRNSWLWLGPLGLACIIAAGTLAGGSYSWSNQLLRVSPLLVVLVIWIVISVRHRLRLAAEIQQEIVELDKLDRGGRAD